MCEVREIFETVLLKLMQIYGDIFAESRPPDPARLLMCGTWFRISSRDLIRDAVRKARAQGCVWPFGAGLNSRTNGRGNDFVVRDKDQLNTWENKGDLVRS